MIKHYESLINYYKNGCVLHPGQIPAWGEVGYKEYIKKKIADMKIKSGDRIQVEQKNHDGTAINYEGILLHMYSDRFRILSKGRTVWKDRSNVKDVFFEYITSIEKIKDAGLDFDIYKADPNYKHIQENKDNHFWDKVEAERIKEFEERAKKVFPDIDMDKNVILYMLFDFYWDAMDGNVEKAEVCIIKKNNESISIPEYKNKHIYPNRFYYTCCGIKNTDEEHDGIVLVFDSIEKLEEIRLISCKWTVTFGDEQDNIKMQCVQMIYPKFIKGEGNVYNIASRCTYMMTYEESLHKHSVFSGMLEKEYDKAFVRIADKEDEMIIEIMNAENIVEENLMDTILCINQNSLKKVCDDLSSDQQDVTEIFIKYADIEPKKYIWPF